MSNDNELQKRAIGGMVWKAAEKVGAQVAQFVIQVVLARLLLPEEYGLVGLLSIFIAVSDVFLQQGLTTALIQKKNADQTDYASVFFANIGISVVLYGILCLIAPLVGTYFHEESLVPLMRVLSLNVVFGAIGAVQNAILSKALDFKKSFFRSCFNVAAQGVVGIGAALMGLGAWSLVLSKISGTLIGSIVLCVTVKWRPSLTISMKRIRSLFSYSSKVLATNLLNTLFNNIHSLIIGRYYTSADLGYYQRGQQMPQAIMTAIDGSFSEVLYPTLSVLQDDIQRLKNTLRRSMKTSMFIVLPLMVGLIGTAESVTVVLLTGKWLPCVPFMQLQCIVCAFWPLAARTHALNAIGKSDVTLKISIISKVITLVLLVICVNFGIYAIMLSMIGTSLIGIWITTYYVKKYIHYTALELVKDILPSLLLSLLMLGVVFLIDCINIHVFVKLIIQITAGAAAYVGGAVITRNDSFAYLMNYIKRFLKRK